MAIKIIAQDPKILANLSGVAFANCCDGVAVGANGIVITTNDAGVSWTSRTSDFAGGFRDVAFADENSVVAVGDECKIRISHDRGVTWTAPPTLRSFKGESDHLAGVSFKDEKTGYAVGVAKDDVDSVYKALVLTTHNGGDTWSDEFMLPEADSLVDVDFSVMSGVTYVVAVGLGSSVGGLIIRTETGTTNWSVVPSKTTNELFGIAFAKAPYAQHGWAVGRVGTIVHTTDGGATWTVQTSGLDDEILLRVAAIDDKHAWVVGIGGSLIFTSDGGENWTRQDTGTGGQQLSELVFCGPCLGTIVGASGAVITLLGRA